MNNTRKWITYLKVELKDLAVGDVLDFSSRDEFRYETIRRIEPMLFGTRLTKLEDQHGESRMVTLTSIGRHHVISGGKLMAARRDPSKVIFRPAGHPVWKGG